MSLRELYQEMIIDHGKSPRNQGRLPEANHCQVGHNPLCGDQITLYVLAENEVVKAISFEGQGCAISMASASLMTEAVKGKSIATIQTLFDHFHNLITEGAEATEDLGKLAVFAGVSEFPMRVKCATLAWHTLKAALENRVDIVSTEE